MKDYEMISKFVKISALFTTLFIPISCVSSQQYLEDRNIVKEMNYAAILSEEHAEQCEEKAPKLAKDIGPYTFNRVLTRESQHKFTSWRKNKKEKIRKIVVYISEKTFEHRKPFAFRAGQQQIMCFFTDDFAERKLLYSVATDGGKGKTSPASINTASSVAWLEYSRIKRSGS